MCVPSGSLMCGRGARCRNLSQEYFVGVLPRIGHLHTSGRSARVAHVTRQGGQRSGLAPAPAPSVGVLHESYAHLRYIWLKKIGRPRRPALDAARMRHRRPCRCPLRPERAALALWVTPVHASSMVESTADDHLTVDGDAMFVVGADPEHAAGTLPSAADH